MTQDDLEREIGRAHMERGTLVKKIACIEQRLGTVAKALSTLAVNRHHEESAAVVAEATNPLDDWTELQKLYARLAELDGILR